MALLWAACVLSYIQAVLRQQLALDRTPATHLQGCESVRTHGSQPSLSAFVRPTPLPCAEPCEPAVSSQRYAGGASRRGGGAGAASSAASLQALNLDPSTPHLSTDICRYGEEPFRALDCAVWAAVWNVAGARLVGCGCPGRRGIAAAGVLSAVSCLHAPLRPASVLPCALPPCSPAPCLRAPLRPASVLPCALPPCSPAPCLRAPCALPPCSPGTSKSSSRRTERAERRGGLAAPAPEARGVSDALKSPLSCQLPPPTPAPSPLLATRARTALDESSRGLTRVC